MAAQAKGLPATGRGRKPAHFTALGGRPRGRQAVWEQIRQLRTFTLGDLASAAFAEYDAVKTYVQSLTKGGYLRHRRAPRPQRGQRGFKRDTYSLIRDIGIEAPRVRRDGSPCLQGRAREQMWRTMRILREGFNADELAINASTEETKVSRVDAIDYLKHLAPAGYIAVVEAGTAGRLTRFRFVQAMFTGPKAPMIQRLKTVYDPNLRKIVCHEEVDA